MATDLDLLQGTWRVTSLEADGKPMPSAALNDARIVITRNRFTSLGMGATYKGLLELDAAKTPKAFDMVFTAGHAKGHRNLGIYKLVGDTWTMCLATSGASRPGKFATKAGTGIALETLERAVARTRSTRAVSFTHKPRRVAPTTATEREAAAPGVRTVLEGEWAMVSGVFSGKALAQNMVAWCKRVTRGDVTMVVAGPQVQLKARFTLDTSSTPHAIDYVNLEGASNGKSQAGIFEVTGDTLQVCMSAPGKSRPRELASKAGDGRSFTTWRLATNQTSP